MNDRDAGELVEVTPPGGIVLDPFMGSGTTGMAALKRMTLGERAAALAIYDGFVEED